MNETSLMHVFEMLVERLSMVEGKLTSMEERERFEADHADNGRHIDGGLYDWRGATIQKCYSGSIDNCQICAVTMTDYDLDDDMLIEDAWVQGSISWLDTLLLNAIGQDKTEDIKMRVRAKLAELELLYKTDQNIDWCITCDSIECTQVLGAKPADSVGLALLRAALKEESGGLIKDVDSSTIYVSTNSTGSWRLEDIVRIAMQGFKRLVPTKEFEKLKIGVYKVERIMERVAFDPSGIRRSSKEMKIAYMDMMPDKRTAIVKYACTFFGLNSTVANTSIFSSCEMKNLTS